MNYSSKPRPPGETGSGTRFLENLAYLVPGYRGYKEKGLRQEEDSRLRGRVLAKLQLVKTLLEDRLIRMDEQASNTAADELNRRLRRIESLAEAVRYAPYGFSGFFEAEKVREETLERLLETDLLLFQDLDDTVEMLRATPHPPMPKQAFADLLGMLDFQIAQIETRLVTRDKILADR